MERSLIDPLSAMTSWAKHYQELEPAGRRIVLLILYCVVVLPATVGLIQPGGLPGLAVAVAVAGALVFVFLGVVDSLRPVVQPEALMEQALRRIEADVPAHPVRAALIERERQHCRSFRAMLSSNTIFRPASEYVSILIDAAERDNALRVTAVAAVNLDETFWNGHIAQAILQCSNKNMIRIFVLDSREDAYAIRKTLEDHSKAYHVYCVGRDTLQQNGISSIEGEGYDFSLIDNTVLAAYSLHRGGDERVDKKIRFDFDAVHDPDGRFAKYKDRFNSILDRSVRLAEYERKNFDQFLSRLSLRPSTPSGPLEGLSRFIDPREYHRHEPDHPYYREMHEQMLGDLRRLRPNTNSRAELRVLEVGAGTGIFTLKVASSAEIVDLTAVEIDRETCDVLRSNVRCQGNVHVVREDIFDMPANEQYDAVVSSFSNHHIPYGRVREYYQHVFKMLRPGGMFIYGEEYIPNLGEHRDRALLRYHHHIIGEALAQGCDGVAGLEAVSLVQGLRCDGEYKVTLESAELNLISVGFRRVSVTRLGPERNGVGGVYACAFQRPEQKV